LAEQSINIPKEDMTDEEGLEFFEEAKRNLVSNPPQPKKEKEKEKDKEKLKNEIVRVKSGVLPPSESDDTSNSFKILSQDEQAAVRQHNLDRKTSYYYAEHMKADHIIPIRMAIDENTDEEIWEERKYQYHELTFAEENKLQRLRATMDDLEKQTYLFNRERAIRFDPEWQTVKRQWQMAKQDWAFYAAKVFLHMAQEDIDRCKSSTLLNVIEACEYRNAVTVPFSQKISRSGFADMK
jgi:hypothetical protein